MRNFSAKRICLLVASFSFMVLGGWGCDVGTVVQDGGVDGGLPADSGVPIDGGQKPDGGIPADGGIPQDGGQGDGGTQQDGSVQDGGVPVDGGNDDGGVTDSGNQDVGVVDSGTGDGGGTDGSVTDGGPKPDGGMDGGASDGGATDGGATDGGGLNPDASYYYDGGQCGIIGYQCCAGNQCVWSLQCQGGKCANPATDGGASDGGPKPDGGMDGGASDGGATDGGGLNPDASYYYDGGQCGIIGYQCCAGNQCVWSLQCQGGKCANPATDGGASDGGATDGGFKPDGGTADSGSSDGGIKPDGGGGSDGGIADGGCSPDCTGKCGGAPNGCGGTCTDDCPSGNNCSGQVCVPCGAAQQPCCDTGSVCDAVEPPLYCHRSTCLSLPICEASPTSRGNDMCLVPMGTFSMGCSKNDSDCAIDEKPLHDVMLSEYWIDRYEVTVSDYASCVDSGICSIPKKAPEPACNYGVSGRDGFPMNCIDYKSAQRYCGWAEKTLPTEAQWEKAARGEYTWIYPWGDAPPASCDMAIMYDPKFAAAGCGTGMSWQGASLNVESPYGAFDMAGNVWEWVSDWYDATYYQTSPSIDPTGPGEGDFIVIRGGAWDDKDVRTSKRGSINPSSMLDNTGFRCAFIKK